MRNKSEDIVIGLRLSVGFNELNLFFAQKNSNMKKAILINCIQVDKNQKNYRFVDTVFISDRR